MMSWGIENAAPETVRAVTTALVPAIGHIGALIG